MMSESFSKIIYALLDKTKHEKAIWNKTSGYGEYKINLGENTITINKKHKSPFSIETGVVSTMQNANTEEINFSVL